MSKWARSKVGHQFLRGKSEERFFVNHSTHFSRAPSSLFELPPPPLRPHYTPHTPPLGSTLQLNNHGGRTPTPHPLHPLRMAKLPHSQRRHGPTPSSPRHGLPTRLACRPNARPNPHRRITSPNNDGHPRIREGNFGTGRNPHHNRRTG